MQVPPLHTPVEMRQISDLAHVMEGVVLGLAAAVVIAQARGVSGRARFAWPGLILLAGAALLGYLFVPHHGVARARLQWGFVLGDPEQRQHVIIAALVTVAGIVELLNRAGRLSARGWRLAWPAALVVIGLMFVLHEQHGTAESVRQAVRHHQYIGIAMLATAALGTLDVLRERPTRWVTASWGFTLLVAAILLGAYREPPGAFQDASPHSGGHLAPAEPQRVDQPRDAR